MADFALEAAPLLGGLDKTIGEGRIVERDDLALVSVAVPLNGDAALKKALKDGWGLDRPAPKQTTNAGDTTAVSMTADQLMLVFPHATPDANAVVKGKLNGAGYTTDQTDSWVVLEVSGKATLSALERLCPLNLDLDAFPVGASGRTTMEHMGALIVRIGEESFFLMSASSSAASFAHAVELSYEWAQ